MIPTPDSLDVSRETFDRLRIYADLLEKWNPRINLVAKSTLLDLWQRHFLDSLQVFRLLDAAVPHWADLGSGGGFPGLIVAIAAAEAGNPAKTTLVESDQRKAAFLRTVLRETSVSAQVIAQRIKKVPPLRADVLSARALAELSTLLEFAHLHLADGGTCLFPKGRNWKSELQTAQKAWHFSFEAIPSQTDSEAVILKIKGIARV
ncbi:16S rRNA (guanine(527)-N(7))-methyltransferase RsmG [Alisedimentitalea sp. MJ-SS2]|uniref:16S rRNA (guanine(527)-N(7))-methyltransferase RsmG n=1 Tax=Aliisedimentitalea sp. MJ-SS2 TaxID=3049795 RepID=UPI002913AA2C|nr:16S rRNA (guanine(527)-N(7))-methyltransferase RsmG [Alisedimentitalea sp. MJ-SS2]MDU8927979.1 16S rRNA (guanine(527)-N(7))-methyltransferase RsmG [Alisedimentitalea sp. MJ-SS2]